MVAKQKAETLKNIIRWVAPLALLVSACSGNSSTSPDETTTAAAAPLVTAAPVESGLEVSQIVTLDYEPGLDGFGFENYGGGQAPASMTVNLARRLYGDEQACVSVTDGECSPQPVILQLIEQANRAMAGGLCEGFAVLSLRLYQEGGTTQLLGQEAIVAALEQGDPRVAAELAFWFVTQFSSETQAAAAFYREQTPSEIVAALADDFANPGTTAGYTLGLYSAEGGHAVTPYAVESIDGGSRIYIYDSNWPSETRWIDVIDNTWVYALAATNPTEAAAAWTGTTGTLELTPMASRQPPFSCAFCPQPGGGKSMTLITAAGSSESQIAIQVVDDEGRRLGVFDGELVNEIPGAIYRYIATANTSDPVFILLPASVENYTADVESVDGSDDGAVSLFVAQDGAGARVETTMADISDAEDKQPVLAVSEDAGYEINDLDDAQVDIADKNVSVSIQIEDNQELAFQFVAPEPPQTPLPPEPGEPDVVTPAPVEPVRAPQIMLSISSDAGEVLAEVEITQEETQEAPEEFVIELNDEGEIEIEIEEIEARPATIFAEMRELVVERIEAEADEDYEDPWHIEPEIEEPEERDEREGNGPEPEEPEPVNFLLDLDSDFWDEDNWDEDWEDEEQEWAWVAGEEFVEWIEEAPEEFAFADTLSDEFFEQMDEIVLFTEELEERLPDRIEGEWTDEGYAVPMPVSVMVIIPEDEEDWEDFDEEPEEFMLMLPPDFDEEIPPDFFTDMPMPWDMDEEEFEEGELFEDDFDDWMPDNSIPEWQMVPDEESGEWQDMEDEWDDWEELAELEEFGVDDEEEDSADIEQANDTDYLSPGDEEEEQEGAGEEEPPDELDSFDGLADDDEEDEPSDTAISPGGPEEEEIEIEIEIVPAPEPSYSGGSQSTLEDLGQTSSTETTEATTVAVTSTLGFNSSDGFWYQQVTTATTVTETAVVTTASSSRMRTDDWYCYDDGYGNGGCDSGTYYQTTQTATTVADPAVVETATTSVVSTIPASCSQGGWTGFGDWCIVGGCSVCSSSTTQTPANRNERDIIQFTVPDDTSVTGETRRIVIEAETNLRQDQFNESNQHGDPFVYLYNDTDADSGDHSGDGDEYTRGTLIELDDDGGRDCSVGGTSWACNNPPSDAVDEAEFPNDTIVGYETPRPVIQNVQNQWDAEIDRLMVPGNYAVEATVYNAANAGWYRLTISDETAESSGS